MVSRRNYFTITVIMAVVFFLFQFINVAVESWNNYEVNPFVEDKEELPGQEEAYGTVQEDSIDSEHRNKGEPEKQDRRKVIYIGNEEDGARKTVKAWAIYTKREEDCFGTLQQYETEKEDSGSLTEMIILNPACIDWEVRQEMDELEEYVKNGIHLVFCGLPEPSVIEKNRRLQDLLGIQEVRAQETTVAGIHLYKGFLLGGETIYQTEDEEENEKRQDMDLTFPWYILGSGTKAYMKGIPEDETVELEERPGIIWRKSFDNDVNSYVFAVNGSYMDDVTGLGLLSAMAAEAKYYEIYPVVNAQNFVVANYPGLACENEEEMQRLYAQSMDGVFRDVIWPDLVSVYQRNQLGISCMIAPQFDYEDDNEPEEDQLIHYMKLLNEQRAEAGLSGVSVSNTILEQKLSEDRTFLQNMLPDYRFTSLYIGEGTQEDVETALQEEWLSQVRTVVAEYTGDNEILGFCSESVTKQTILTDGFMHTYREDFRLKSVETALGYSSVGIDMIKVAYSGEGEDTWKDISYDLGWNIRYYWKPFQKFEGTTVSECDKRIRNFFMLDYRMERNGSVISLEISGLQEPVWFLLRTKDEAIEGMEGGSWQRLEDNIYLLEVESEEVILEMVPDQYFYIFE